MQRDTICSCFLDGICFKMLFSGTFSLSKLKHPGKGLQKPRAQKCCLWSLSLYLDPIINSYTLFLFLFFRRLTKLEVSCVIEKKRKSSVRTGCVIVKNIFSLNVLFTYNDKNICLVEYIHNFFYLNSCGIIKVLKIYLIHDYPFTIHHYKYFPEKCIIIILLFY